MLELCLWQMSTLELCPHQEGALEAVPPRLAPAGLCPRQISGLELCPRQVSAPGAVPRQISGLELRPRQVSALEIRVMQIETSRLSVLKCSCPPSDDSEDSLDIQGGFRSGRLFCVSFSSEVLSDGIVCAGAYSKKAMSTSITTQWSDGVLCNPF